MTTDDKQVLSSIPNLPGTSVSIDSTRPDCRWERSKWPHPKFPRDLHAGLLPDVIWIRFHTVFRGGMMEEVTGWQSTDPNA